MSSFEHPDPNWTPRLAWGDRIPLHWVRVSAGLWFVWPPRQFETLELDRPNVWRFNSGSSGYEPERRYHGAPVEAVPFTQETTENPLTEWGGSIPAQWSAYDNGRVIVSMRDLEVSLPPAKVNFRLAHSFVDHQLDYFYPSFIWNPPIEPRAAWASCRCGPLSPPNASERSWFYPSPNGRRWVGKAWVEPTGVTFAPLDHLLPLDLPSDAEIASEEEKLRKIFRLEEGEPLNVRPHVLMLRDLAGSAKLMELVGGDAFAAEFRNFVFDTDFLHKPSGKLVDFSSDNNGAWMLSVLRRYGECLTDCEYLNGSAKEYHTPLEQLFREVGYVVYDPPVDEEARRDRLKRIGESIPRSILEHMLGRQHVPPTIQLAWAMGHFWSEDDGWTEPALPLSSEEYRSLKGGHFPDAAEIVDMIKAEEIKLS